MPDFLFSDFPSQNVSSGTKVVQTSGRDQIGIGAALYVADSLANAALMAVAEPAAVIQLLLIALAFGALTYAFVTSDFSLRLVVLNSHTDKPMLYKVSGVWGNHEGSLLLWVLILALFGASAAIFGGNLPATLRARVLAVNGGVVLDIDGMGLAVDFQVKVCHEF